MCCFMRTHYNASVLNCISGIEFFECGENYSQARITKTRQSNAETSEICRCFTLFSHSNYEEGQNQGAVLVLWYLPLLCSFPLQFLALLSSPSLTRTQPCMHSDHRYTDKRINREIDKELYCLASNHDLLYRAAKRTTS